MARRRHSNRRRRRGNFGFLYKLLSVLVICAAVVMALTLFFRVDTIEVTGTERYTEKDVIEASGIQLGDNLFLLNKYEAARSIAEQLPYIDIIGSPRPEDHHGVISFNVRGIHPHDVASILDMDQVAIRAGHHCAQPLLAYLKHPSTARASLAFYNTESLRAAPAHLAWRGKSGMLPREPGLLQRQGRRGQVDRRPEERLEYFQWVISTPRRLWNTMRTRITNTTWKTPPTSTRA